MTGAVSSKKLARANDFRPTGTKSQATTTKPRVANGWWVAKRRKGTGGAIYLPTEHGEDTENVSGGPECKKPARAEAPRYIARLTRSALATTGR